MLTSRESDAWPGLMSQSVGPLKRTLIVRNPAKGRVSGSLALWHSTWIRGTGRSSLVRDYERRGCVKSPFVPQNRWTYMALAGHCRPGTTCLHRFRYPGEEDVGTQRTLAGILTMLDGTLWTRPFRSGLLTTPLPPSTSTLSSSPPHSSASPQLPAPHLLRLRPLHSSALLSSLQLCPSPPRSPLIPAAAMSTWLVQESTGETWRPAFVAQPSRPSRQPAACRVRSPNSH